ncbi:MAG: hypothetical protein K2Q06_04485 [Parvularculaceae bacterium]|nr:hypothetical protein [Parvularculaceae bacterium]
MLGFLGLMGAVAVAGWLLLRSRRAAPAESGRTVTLLKFAAFLGLAAALFAARLWPFAFMVLVAATAITAIEIWRERAIKSETPTTPPAPPAPARAAMSREEAASVLGVRVDAPAEEVRAAHRRLIGQLHPDKGGSDYLASKINQARDVLAGGS